MIRFRGNEAMSTLTLGHGGEITLPGTLRDRYGLVPDRRLRVIETRSGILLVPLTDAPMGPELRAELAEWQALADETWGEFPYEDGTDE
jgi:bifunctional DNA-binding transcriptional regulator/antitoxin component of YhaV-PrlF toxin-antitoxin module